MMSELLDILGFDRSDPGDLQDFVMWLRNKFLWLCYFIISAMMIYAIFKAGDGSLPPEPQWWLDVESFFSEVIR
jgi:hypothetical protein